jgi:NAD(P)-dependent dehydrogenase (short-subunit alcohol dehydrogenase family)
VLTEALMPHLPDGADVVFVCSGVEDPERRPAAIAGFRGGRYISAEASTRGEWKPGGGAHPGFDAYATSKQCELATMLALARQTPRLRFNAVEPGFIPATNLGRDASAVLRLLSKHILSLFAPFIRYWSTPARAAKIITIVLLNEPGATGCYCNDHRECRAGGARRCTGPRCVLFPEFLPGPRPAGVGLLIRRPDNRQHD